GLVIVLVVGAYRVSGADIKVGAIIAMVTYFTIILNAMMSITRIFIQISRASASAKRIEEVLVLKDEMIDGQTEIVESEDPHIEFDHVYFSYHDKEDHLEDINFKIYKGQTLGIIGATGSGKTTLINLLMRFYDPQKGSIRIFGINLKDLRRNDLRRHIGLVLQNDQVFSDTIYENIQFSRFQIPKED